MQVPRIEFCTLVPDAAVDDALGGKPDSDSAYGNGDEVEMAGVGKDVVHEIGCSWTGDDGTAARAWVFARPVDTTFAQTVIASGRRPRGAARSPARRTASRPPPSCAGSPTASSESGTRGCSGRPG